MCVTNIAVFNCAITHNQMDIMDNKFYFFKVDVGCKHIRKEQWVPTSKGTLTTEYRGGKKPGYTISHNSLPVISLRQNMVRHM